MMTNKELNMFDKNTQKELKAKYKELLADAWDDSSMIEFCSKKAEVVFKTEKGFFLEIEKEGIKKDFCFGYHCSNYNTDSFDSAESMVRHAKKSTDYFRAKNLEHLEECIKFYSDTSNELFFQNHYHRQKNDVLKNVCSFKYWDMPKDIISKEYREYTPVSENDRKLIVEAYKKELELFTKRLETYIKRYGLSKVHSWSYWLDE